MAKYLIDYAPKHPGNPYHRHGSFPPIYLTQEMACQLVAELDRYWPDYTHTARRIDQ